MNEKLVTVARYNDYVGAELARQTLEDAGIRAFVMRENTGIAWPVPAAGGIELQTAESQAREAQEVLAAAPKPEPQEGQGSEEDEE